MDGAEICHDHFGNAVHVVESSYVIVETQLLFFIFLLSVQLHRQDNPIAFNTMHLNLLNNMYL